LGFGIETQAREVDIGLNSARGSIRRRVGEAMLSWKTHAGYKQLESC
jgi:hypothetical protein